MKPLRIAGLVVGVGALVVSCTIDHQLLFGKRGENVDDFPAAFECNAIAPDGAVEPQLLVESALTGVDGGALLNLTLVADFITVKGALKGESVNATCAPVAGSPPACVAVKAARSCVRVQDLPVAYKRKTGVALPNDGGLSAVLEGQGWNLTANGNAPSGDVIIRVVALTGVDCTTALAEADAHEGDLYTSTPGNVVGCTISPIVNLHDAAPQILLNLQAPTNNGQCTANEVAVCASLFNDKSCIGDGCTE